MTTSDGAFYRAAVPSGASTGMFLNQIFGEMNYGDNHFHLCC